MAFEIQSTDGLAHIRMHGCLTVADMREIVAELDQIERQHTATPPRLVDITDVTNVSVDFRAVHEVSLSRATVKLRNAVKTAIVAPSMLQFGVARMFEMLNQQRQTEVMVFRDMNTARAWLQGGTAAKETQI